MKTSNMRNLFLVSLALPLVMLFGCSSSEEEAPPPDSSGGGVDCSTYPTEAMQQECELGKEVLD